MTSTPAPGQQPCDRKLRLDVTFPADVNRIAEVVDRVAAIVRETHGETEKEMEIALALTEALANAVKHGCKNDPSKTVQCRVATEPSGTMVIVVRDSGEGFDPSLVPNPMQSENINLDHGRGLHMIRQLMDEVHYERHGTEIHMTKRF